MGLIFGNTKPVDKNTERLFDLDGIIDELMFRHDHNQTLYPCFRKRSWDDVCDEAISLLQNLKGAQR